MAPKMPPVKFDFGYLLIGLCIVSAIAGVACAIIGGILRFNLTHFVNGYFEDFDRSDYKDYNDILPSKKEFDDIDLGSVTETMGSLAIALGVFVLSYSAIGIVGGLLKQAIFMFVLFGLNLLTFILELVLLWMLKNGSGSFHSNAKDELAEKMSSYDIGNSNNAFSVMLNSFMLYGGCCGVRGVKDFETNLTFDNRKYGISPACCTLDGLKSIVVHTEPEEVTTTAAAVTEAPFEINGTFDGNATLFARFLLNDTLDMFGGNASNISDIETTPAVFIPVTQPVHICTGGNLNPNGCYDTVFDAASDGLMGTCFVLLILLLLWQVAIGAVALIIVMSPKKDDKPTKAQIEAEAPPPEPEVKPFTPFSKLSSAQVSAIGRIKSTEIW